MGRIMVLALVALSACAVADDGEFFTPTPDYQYVVSNLDMPTTPSQAATLGFDLDGDPSSSPDNHLGSILSQLFAAEIADMDEAADNLIRSGAILHLLEVEARSFDGRQAAGAELSVGRDDDDDPADNFTGTESFSVEVEASEQLTGFVNQGLLQVGPGTLTIRLALPGGESPLEIDLVAARIEAEMSDGLVVGRLGGAITRADIDDVLIPFVHQAIGRLIGLDCPGGECGEDSTGAFFLELLDTNRDGEVALGELRGHPLVEVLAKPDVDLFDEDGNLVPRSDGVADALSFAVGIGAVPASF